MDTPVSKAPVSDLGYQKVTDRRTDRRTDGNAAYD